MRGTEEHLDVEKIRYKKLLKIFKNQNLFVTKFESYCELEGEFW